MWQVMLFKLVIGLVKRLELAALKLFYKFFLWTGNTLSKLCMIKRNFPNSSKNYTFNTNNNPFLLARIQQEWMNHSRINQGRKLTRNNLVNACYTRDGMLLLQLKLMNTPRSLKFVIWMTSWKFFPNFDFEDEPSSCISWCIRSVNVLSWIWPP